MRADGVVCSMSRKPPYRFPRSAPHSRGALARQSIRWLRDVEQTTPAAPAKEASRHFLNGHSHPSLAKEGSPLCPGITCVPSSAWPRRGGRTIKKYSPLPLDARPGWFVQQPIIGGLNQPPRLRPLMKLRDIYLMVAATPPWPRRGVSRAQKYRQKNKK